MAEKKTATAKVAKMTTEKKASEKEVVKKVATKATKSATPAANNALYINSESVGFRAGDIYQTLAAASKTLTVDEIAKTAKLTKEEVLLGLGWLFKEGKVVGENVADLRLA